MKKMILAIAGFVIVVFGYYGVKSHVMPKQSTQRNAAATISMKELNIQFIPSVQADTMLAKAKPLEALLEKKLGVPVHVSVATNYNTMLEAMGSKKVDMGFLSPDGYLNAHKQYGAKVILQSARYKTKNENTSELSNELTDSYRSMIVVKKDSNIKSVKDLKGKKIAVQSANSTSGYIYPVATLYKQGVNVVKDANLVQVKGHDQGLLSVLNGDTDAAFVIEAARSIVQKDKPNVFNETRVIEYTKPIPNDTITLRKDISEKDTQTVKTAMKEVAESKEGSEIFNKIYSWAGILDSKDSNFDRIREYSDTVSKIK